MSTFEMSAASNLYTWSLKQTNYDKTPLVR